MENSLKGLKIFNRSYEPIWIRISTDGKNDEFWTAIYNSTESFFEREPGTYLIQIKRDLHDERDHIRLFEVNSPADLVIPSLNGINHTMDDSLRYSGIDNSVHSSVETDFCSTWNLFKDFDESSRLRDITVENKNKKTIYFKVSGYGGGSEEWQAIKPNEKGIVKRNIRYKNYLEFSSMPIATSGKVIFTRAGDSFIIDNNYSICLTDGTIPLILDRNFRSVSHDRFYNGDGKLQTPLKIFSEFGINTQKDKFLLINNTGMDISARISSNGIGNEDYVQISPSSYHFWDRYQNYYYTFEILYNDFIFRYKTLCFFEGYIFNPTMILTNETNQIKSFIREKWSIDEDDEYVLKINDKSYIEKKLRKIEFLNDTNQNIWIRVQATDIGSEELFLVEKGNTLSFNRNLGNYFAEIIIDEKMRFKYEIFSLKKYIFDQSHNLIDNETNQNISLTKGGFFSPCKFDLPKQYDIPIVEPKQDDIPIVEPKQDDIPIVEPKQDDYPILEPKQDDYPIVEPKQDDIPVVEPKQDDIPVVEPKQDDIPVVEPKQDDYPIVEPKQDDYPIVEPKQDDYPVVEPKQDDYPIVEPKQDDYPIVEPKQDDFPVVEPKQDDIPIIIEPVHNDPAIIQPIDHTPYYLNKKPNMNNLIKGSFYDEDFPPEIRIINSYDENNLKINQHFSHSEDQSLSTDYLSFKRPREIFKNKQFYLFKDKIECDDLKQGDIGNCYFITTLSSLSKNPETIQTLFKTKSANDKGLYEIYFFYEGKKQIIYIDDHIPVDSLYGTPKYAQPNEEEIWVLLLEKAFAKFEGGYSNIVGGSASYLFEFLTGKKSESYYDDEKHKWWNVMGSSTKRYCFVYAGSNKGTGSDKDSSYRNIFYKHAYSILDAKEYVTDTQNIKLVQCRNPWGTGEWKGDFCDNSPCWTPELINYFNAKEVFKDDGRFWMKFEDFLNEFRYIVVCEFDELWS